jgi:hypothetical protein
MSMSWALGKQNLCDSETCSSSGTTRSWPWAALNCYWPPHYPSFLSFSRRMLGTKQCTSTLQNTSFSAPSCIGQAAIAQLTLSYPSCNNNNLVIMVSLQAPCREPSSKQLPHGLAKMCLVSPTLVPAHTPFDWREPWQPGVPIFTIVLIGCWPSAAFLRYIWPQVLQCSVGFSKCMVSKNQAQDFFTLPDFDPEHPRVGPPVGEPIWDMASGPWQ